LPVPLSDEHRRVARRDLADGREDLLHRRRLAGHVRGRRGGRVGRLRPRAARSREGLLDHEPDLVLVERLLDEVRGAALHGVDGERHRAVRRHEHHRQARVLRPDVLEQRHAVHAGHPDVGEHEIPRPRLELAHGVLRRRHMPGFEPPLLEQRYEHTTDRHVVVDDEDGVPRVPHGPSIPSRESR
jgi:hypothetical protein